MDGVLADVRDSYRACILETLAQFGCSISKEEIAEAKLRSDANNDWILTHRLLAINGIRQPLNLVTRVFQSFYLGIQGRGGFREHETLLIEPAVLDRLARRYPLAIVTGRPRAEAVWFLERFGITRRFNTLIGMEDAPAKPSPAAVKLASTALGITCPWMMGDTPDDMEAAAGAEAFPVGVLQGDDPEKERSALTDSGAEMILSTINELERYLP